MAPSAEDVAVLRGLLRDDLSADVRLAALGALARASEPDQLDDLVLALADADAGVRTSGLETLAVAGTSRAAVQVLAAADDDHETVRAAAYRRLAAAPPWLRWMALGRCSHRSELVGVLTEDDAGDGLVELVLERVSSPDPGDRVLALELTGHLGVPALLAEAVSALADAEAVVRRAAAAQLAGHDRAVPGLLAALEGDPDPAVRHEAARSLADAGSDAVLAAFVAALQDPETGIRHLATEVLLRHRSAGLARRLAAELTTSNLDSVGVVLLGMGPTGEEALVVAASEGPAESRWAAAELFRKTVVKSTPKP